MKKTEETAPIEKLAALILNKAIEKHADRVCLELLEVPALTDEGLQELEENQTLGPDDMIESITELMKTSSVAVKYRIDQEWQDVEPFPVFLWSNVRNLYLLWAGVEYWQKGSTTGRLNNNQVGLQWNFLISEDHNKLEFELITNG